ncbi:MAG: hypothetical protein JXJ04_19870 [Spirochaetales bacterium]|nr:hypothetical protein [Spirochaetales bacterium]
MKKIVFCILFLCTLSGFLFAQSPPPPDYYLQVFKSGVSSPVMVALEGGSIHSTNEYPISVGFSVPTTVTLTALNYEYPDGAADVFMRWDGDITSYDNPVTFDVNGRLSLTAMYAHGDPTPTSMPTPMPTPFAGAGSVRFSPLTLSADSGSIFAVELLGNTGEQLLGSYSFDVQFNASIIQLVNEYGVVAGADGFLTSVDLVSNDKVSISGTDTTGTGPGENLHILTLHFNAIGSGTSILSLTINSLEDETSATIGTPTAINGTVTVVCCMTPTPLPGDVNNDNTIDIVDALLTAQFYVGLTPSGFAASNADVNCDGGVDIIDALLIAQYYVGLIDVFC